VNGPMLDAVLPRMKTCGRIVACGGISQYNLQEPYGVKGTMHVSERLSDTVFSATCVAVVVRILTTYC
jgi:NADPH-dependent curcumin reductase CurA